MVSKSRFGNLEFVPGDSQSVAPVELSLEETKHQEHVGQKYSTGVNGEAFVNQTIVSGGGEAFQEEFGKALDAQCRGDYSCAMEFYSRALGYDRTSLEARVGQLQMLIHLEEYPEAIQWSGKGLELFRGNGELLSAQAQAWLRLGDFNKGRSISETLLKVPGVSWYRWLVRAEIQMAFHESAAAMTLLNVPLSSKEPTAEDHQPMHNSSHWLPVLEAVLVCRRYRFQPEKSLELLQELAARVPITPFAYRQWIELGLELGKREVVAEGLQKLKEHDSGSSITLEMIRKVEGTGRFWRRFWPFGSTSR